MRAIDRKLIRDLTHVWTQVLAIAAVIAAGVAVCITMFSALASLEDSRDRYYAGARFADVFSAVERAPLSAADRLRALAGIDVVEPRVVADVTLDVPGLEEPAIGRLISLPAGGREPALNQLVLRRGAFPDTDGEVLASEAFVTAHAMQVGDTVAAVMNGRWKRLRIAGVVLSPEYVYSIRGGDLFPDNARFGVFWMRRDELAAAFDLDGAFNDVAIRLSRGANVSEAIRSVDAVLARYGGVGAYARKDQTSAWYLENELAQLTNMGRVTPFIFAGVAAFLLNIVISRLVATQREQIGVLKAFGYSRTAVAAHYLSFVLVIVAIGVAAGIGAGAWTGYLWTRMYAAFFHFPSLAYRLPPAVVIVSVIVATVLAAAATLQAVSRAARVPAAEAMRPESPAVYRTGLLDRLGVERRLPPTGRMIARNIERRPIRAVLSVVAIALAVAIVIVGIFTVDSVHYLTDVQFNAAQRQHVTLGFTEPRTRRAIYEIERLPGVLRAEPVRIVAARLRNGWRSRRIGIVGLADDGRLARIVDERLHPIALPPEGLVLNDALASVLDVRRGDVVSVEVLEGARPIRDVTVADVVSESLGLNGYMDVSALNRLMREGSVVSGAYLQVDRRDATALYRRLKQIPGITGVTINDAARKSFEQTFAEVIAIITTMFATFGAAIAFAVIYNNTRIALAERARELGTLHVLGFSHVEMAEILLGEMAALTAVGLPAGVLVGRLLANLVVTLFSTELARIPVVISPATNGFAILVTLAAAAASALIVWRRLERLDVLAVLKAPE